MKKLKYAVLALAAIALVGCGANKDTAKSTTSTTSVTCTTSSKTGIKQYKCRLKHSYRRQNSQCSGYFRKVQG